MKILLSFFLLSVLTLHAGIEDHFKKAPHKEGDHRFGNIDFVYMINLDKRSEKFQLSQSQLTPYGINPYRFSAVNGWEELPLATLNEIGLKFAPGMIGGYLGTCYPVEGDNNPSHQVISEEGQTYFCHCLSKGAIGCAMSHLSVLQDAYDSGYELIWVMEDDIKVCADPRVIPKLIDELDAVVGRLNWDILFTDKDAKKTQGENKGDDNPCIKATRKPNLPSGSLNRYSQRHQITPDLRTIGARYGAYSMILNRHGMKKILDYFKTYKLFLPYDMEFFLPKDMKLFCVNDDVVSHLQDGLSDNGCPYYLNKP